MRFFKVLKYDLSYGIIKNLSFTKIIIWIVFFTLVSYEFSGRLGNFNFEKFSLGDSFLYTYGGIKEFIPSPNELFIIPYLWILNNLLVLFFTLHYANDDLNGYGHQLILRTENRTSWWFSKCIWNSIIIIIYYIIAWIVTTLNALLRGAELNFEISEYMSVIMVFGSNQIASSGWILLLEITLMPLIITIALGMVQMALSLVFKPAFAFIFSSVMLISSAYYMTPYLIGNFAMAVRSDKVVSNGLNLTDGIIAAIGMIIIGIIIGVLAIRRYNILSKE